MPVANELLHFLRRNSHPGAPLHPPSRPGYGPRQRVGMRLARLPTPVIGRGGALRVSWGSRQRENRAREIGGRGYRLLVASHERSDSALAIIVISVGWTASRSRCPSH